MGGKKTKTKTLAGFDTESRQLSTGDLLLGFEVSRVQMREMHEAGDYWVMTVTSK